MTIQPWQSIDTEWDRASLTELRETLITLRDGALGEGNFQLSVPMSHAIAVFAHIIEEMDK